MKDIVGTVGKYIRNFSKEDQSTVYTPMNIAEDMVNLLPDNIFKPDKKFIDIACKSGRFLLAIYNRLMSSPYMANMEPERRSKWILDNQLYAIALTEISSVLIRKSLYDDYTVKGNIILINSYTDKIKKNNFGQNANGSVKTLKELLSEEFNQVNFDVVIGNPPYNNDIYLDFVTQGHNLAKQYDVWITPAKWQAKGGKKNEDFRENIVPHMNRIVYYPCSTDVFDIDSQGGVSFFITDKKFHEAIVSRHGDNAKDAFMSGGENAICKISGVYSLMPRSIINIVHKTISKKQLKIENCTEVNGQFNIKITNVFSDIKRISKSPSLVLIEPYIQTSIGDKNSHTSCIRSFNSELQAKSFISYLNTRTVRFLVLLNAYTVALINNETWRFVPDPGSFDHIFTDAELYKKYNLTPEEINIIESVIKERK